jgi:hypothetical protein
MKWSLVAGASVLTATGIWTIVSASHIKEKLEEKARQAVVDYLEKRFDANVQFQSLRLETPTISSFSLLMRQGRGVLATVDGNQLVMYQRSNPGASPLFRIPHFRFHFDLGLLSGPAKNVPRVEIEGMEINIPPRGERPETADQPGGDSGSVSIGEIQVTKCILRLMPRDHAKPPLRFDIDDLLLNDAGASSAMTYKAHLTNPRPPGRIDATGHFGPWNKGEPSDTPLDGDYRFNHADLSIFSGISGILTSTGKFSGTLDEINVKGEARVPDFALKSAGNPVPLVTDFEALVDGTNGNTTLKPVKALLGKKTRFVTSGAIIKHEEFGKRAITLAVNMKNGELTDLLRLGMKGDAFMKGTLQMNAKISIPPQNKTVREKLGLIGDFAITDGLFLKDSIEDKVDDLSRRGQGQPKNPAINNVVYKMHGRFNMQNEKIDLSGLDFDVPGATVRLDGGYNMASDALDFHGELRLDAKVSQTMTGWKRWLAKPVDPFFAKDGAGTLLKIKITGTAQNPSFGLDHGPRTKSKTATP